MAKQKEESVEHAGGKDATTLTTDFNEGTVEPSPITADEMRAWLSEPPICPAGVSLHDHPGGIGIYSGGKPIRDVRHLIEWLEDIRQLIADAPMQGLLEHSRGVLEHGYRWRRWFTKKGPIPNLSAVTEVAEVESRLIDLIDDLTNGLRPSKGANGEESATSADTTSPRPDGPILSDGFRFNGREVLGLPEEWLNLLTFVWRKRDAPPTLNEVMIHVTHDRERSSFDKLLTRIRRKLLNAGWPESLEVFNRRVYLRIPVRSKKPTSGKKRVVETSGKSAKKSAGKAKEPIAKRRETGGRKK